MKSRILTILLCGTLLSCGNSQEQSSEVKSDIDCLISLCHHVGGIIRYRGVFMFESAAYCGCGEYEINPKFEGCSGVEPYNLERPISC